MKKVWMKRLGFCFVLLLIVSTFAIAALRNVLITWDYNGPQEYLAGFNVYVGGVSVCNQPNPLERSVLCINTDLIMGNNSFTISAYDEFGQEGSLSPPFLLEVLPPIPVAPENGKAVIE